METNINQILGVSDTPDQNQKLFDDYSTEQIVALIAKIILIIGIISAFAMFIIYLAFKREFYGQEKTIFTSMSIILSISTLLSSTIVWGLLKVICNISNTLKDINSKIKSISPIN